MSNGFEPKIPPIELTPEEEKYVKEKARAWQNFRNSDLGKACLAVAEKEKERLLSFIVRPVADILVLSKDMHIHTVQEMRAEIRGALAVWNQILVEPEIIFARLAEMNRKKE